MTIKNKSLQMLSLLTLLCSGTFATCAYAAGTVETAGDALALLLPATAGGYALYTRDNPGIVQFTKSMSLNLAVTLGLKWTVKEKRPNGGGQSFPSGHTSVAFCSAEFIRRHYGNEYGIPAYVAAAYVGYSRIESKEHYAGDVFAGAAIGITSSYLFTKPVDGWNVHLSGDARSIGMSFSRPL